MDRFNSPRITLASFAQKHIDFFENVWGRDERARYYLFDDMDFPRNCRSFGFEMDCGHSFIEKMGEDLWNSPQGLNERIHETDDIKLIGSAIFSKWRYFNHWSYSGPTEEDVEWFLIMFRRLRELAWINVDQWDRNFDTRYCLQRTKLRIGVEYQIDR